MSEKKYSLSELLARSPELAAATKIIEQEKIEKRKKLHEELMNCKTTVEQKIPKFIEAEKRAEKDHRESLETSQKLMACWAEQSRARREFCNIFDKKIEELEHDLKNSCDPEIVEALIFFNAALQAARYEPSQTSEQVIGYDVLGRAKIVTSSNHKTILQKVDYLKNAIAEIEKMKLLPVCDFEEIEKLKAAIQKTTGEV